MFGRKTFYNIILAYIFYLIYVSYKYLTSQSSISLVPKETWWAESDTKIKVDDQAIYPFAINISEKVSNIFIQ